MHAFVLAIIYILLGYTPYDFYSNSKVQLVFNLFLYMEPKIRLNLYRALTLVLFRLLRDVKFEFLLGKAI
ncbi:hypothetical protein M918_17990 [Clostridium sp. BL8]|nr:hypothetical protein M918_17990 [Clostridium sp. BL8]